MLRTYLTTSLALIGAGALWQASVPQNLEASAKALQDAATFQATFTVTPSGGANRAYKLSYAKPNFFKIESPEGFVLSDGKDLYDYKKATNEFTVTPLSDALVRSTSGALEFWGWASFFTKDPFKDVRAQASGHRKIKDNEVDVVSATFGVGGEATIFVDSKLGLVRGFMAKNKEKDLLVMASELKVGAEAPAAGAFAFAAPEGAKKAEAPKASDATYAKVKPIMDKSCMPCHGAGMRSGGVDLSSFDGTVRSVSPGNPDGSRLVKAVESGRMPQGRPKLSDADIKTIRDWIAEGAKNN